MKVSSGLILAGAISYSGSALAIARIDNNDPTFWIGLVFSAVLLIISGYVKGVKDDQRELKSRVDILSQTLYKDYLSKVDLNNHLESIERWMQRIDKRLDGMED